VTPVVRSYDAKADHPSEQAALAKAKDSAFARGELVMEAGWATASASKTPHNVLAITCTNSLRPAKAGA
jgi:hypothetical protein